MLESPLLAIRLKALIGTKTSPLISFSYSLVSLVHYAQVFYLVA